MFLILLEITVACIVLIFFVTQLIIPLFRGTVFFPMFREESDLETKLRKTKQKKLEKNLQDEIKKNESI
jgi:hypothetical protein